MLLLTRGDCMKIDYKKVGKRISKRRKELGLKQYEVCEMIDVNYKYLSNLETGRSAPSLELIMNLCDVLQTTPNYFLIGTSFDSHYDKDITSKITSLSDEHKYVVSEMIRLLLNIENNEM